MLVTKVPWADGTCRPPRAKGRAPSPPRGPRLAGSPRPGQNSGSRWICGLKRVFCVLSAFSVLSGHVCHDPMNETKEQKARHQRTKCMTTLPNLSISPKTGEHAQGLQCPRHAAALKIRGLHRGAPRVGCWEKDRDKLSLPGSARSTTAPTCPGGNAQPIRASGGILDHSRTKV